MSIDKIQETVPQNTQISELLTQNNINNEIQEDVNKETVETTPQSSQKQVMQLLVSAQPLQAIQQTAQDQIEKDKGFDVRV